MSKITVTVNGMDRIFRILDNYDELPEVLVEKMAQKIYENAVMETPERLTGAAKASWKKQQLNLQSYLIINSQKYLHYVNYGTTGPIESSVRGKRMRIDEFGGMAFPMQVRGQPAQDITGKAVRNSLPFFDSYIQEKTMEV